MTPGSMQRVLRIILFILTPLVTLLPQTNNLPAEGLSARLDSVVSVALKANRIPGMAIGVVHQGNVLVERAYGYADVENRVPATANTVYQLGSVTKVVTGHLLSILIARGVMTLDEPVSRFFPLSVRFPFDDRGADLTIRHLATHSGAFPRYPGNLDRIDPDPIRGYAIDQMYEAIGEVEPDSEYGTRYFYSNFGYGVLGVAMGARMDADLEELLSEHIFKPLGMASTSLTEIGTIEERLAVPYLNVNPLERTEPWDMGTLSAAGNLFSTVPDLNRFMIHLLDTSAANALQQKAYLKINDTWNYGLGCFVIDSQERQTRIIYHGGDIDGYASSMTLYPEYGLGFVILTNYGEGQVIGQVFDDIGKSVTGAVLPPSSRE